MNPIIEPAAVPARHYFLELLNTPGLDSLFRGLLLAGAGLFLGAVFWMSRHRED